MSSVCWLEDRDDRLARARARAASDPAGALALVASVLAEVPDDPEAVRVMADLFIDLGDGETDPARALPHYERAIELLGRHGLGGAPELAAARRARDAALATRTSPA